jgi:MoaA/NifB/PqqE/SkfB family radical SAM enzyme
MKLSHIFTGDIRPGKLFLIPDAPINVMLDVTYSCNNRCLFCYNPESNFTVNGPTSSVILNKIVETVAMSGTKEILYLGGEPFSHPDMCTILETGKKNGLFQRAVSNGSFFNSPEKSAEFASAGLNEVGISLHSAVERIHDQLSGRSGAFCAAFRGIENSLKAGLNTFVQYSPNNLNPSDDLFLLVELIFRNFGSDIGMYDINRLLPIGMGVSGNDLFLSAESWFDLLVDAAELSCRGKEIRVELSPFCWIEKMVAEKGFPSEIKNEIFKINRGCFMWIAQLPLDPNGRIKFCPAGSAVGPSILDVDWPSFWKYGEEFENYRQFIWNKSCIDFEEKTVCPHFYSCLGGCKYSKGKHFQVDLYSQGVNFWRNKKTTKRGGHVGKK